MNRPFKILPFCLGTNRFFIECTMYSSDNSNIQYKELLLCRTTTNSANQHIISLNNKDLAKCIPPY